MINRGKCRTSGRLDLQRLKQKSLWSDFNNDWSVIRTAKMNTIKIWRLKQSCFKSLFKTQLSIASHSPTRNTTCEFGEYTSGCCCKQTVAALLSKQISSRDFHHEVWRRPDIWNVYVLFCCTRRQSGANATRWKHVTAAGYMTEGEEKAESSLCSLRGIWQPAVLHRTSSVDLCLRSAAGS
jgi:hypothetical protein